MRRAVYQNVCRFPGAIVGPFAQAFNRSFARQARKRLGDSSEGKVSEIFKTPDPLAASFNSLANCGSDLSRHRGTAFVKIPILPILDY